MKHGLFQKFSSASYIKVKQRTKPSWRDDFHFTEKFDYVAFYETYTNIHKLQWQGEDQSLLWATTAVIALCSTAKFSKLSKTVIYCRLIRFLKVAQRLRKWKNTLFLREKDFEYQFEKVTSNRTIWVSHALLWAVISLSVWFTNTKISFKLPTIR